MTVRINKPAFNVREKLKSLDYSHIPYEKMPAGSVIKTKFMKSNDGNSFSSTSYQYTGITMDFSPTFNNSKLHLVMNVAYWMSSASGYAYTKVTQTIGGVETTAGEWKDNYQASYSWSGMQNFETIYEPNTTETITYKWYVRSNTSGIQVWFPNDSADLTGDKLMFYIQEIKQ